MNLMILFDGKEYFVESVAENVHPDTILENRPGGMLLDHATSQEDALVKIQQDRDRHQPVWT